MASRIQVLSGIRVLRDDGPAELSARWVREILGLLALNANVFLSNAQISRRVWDRDPDTWTRTKIERAIDELQQVIDPPARPVGDDTHQGVRLESSIDGTCHRLVAPADCTDLMTVERLHAEARQAAERGEHGVAVERSGQALAIWDRDTTGSLRATSGWPEVAALRELRALLEQDHYSWVLEEGGDPDDAVDPLRELSSTHAEDESWCALLMTALATSGRCDEAALAYHHMADHLSLEWGLEPGPRLRGERRRIDRLKARANGVGAEASIVVISRHPEQLSSDDDIQQTIRDRGGVIVWRIRLVVMALFTGPGRCHRAVEAATTIQDRRALLDPVLARTAKVVVGSGWADRCTPGNSVGPWLTGPVLAGNILPEGREAFFDARPGSVTVDEVTAQQTDDMAVYESDRGGYRLLTLRH